MFLRLDTLGIMLWTELVSGVIPPFNLWQTNKCRRKSTKTLLVLYRAGRDIHGHICN